MSAINTRRIVWKIAKTTTALSAAVPGKLAAAITRATPTFHAAVVRPTALRMPVGWPARTQPATSDRTIRKQIPANPFARLSDTRWDVGAIDSLKQTSVRSKSGKCGYPFSKFCRLQSAALSLNRHRERLLPDLDPCGDILLQQLSRSQKFLP